MISPRTGKVLRHTGCPLIVNGKGKGKAEAAHALMP